MMMMMVVQRVAYRVVSNTIWNQSKIHGKHLTLAIGLLYIVVRLY